MTAKWWAPLAGVAASLAILAAAVYVTLMPYLAGAR